MNRNSLVTTALLVGLLVSGCDQESNPVDEAESYAMQSCDIVLENSETGDLGKYVMPESGGTWSIKDSLVSLRERETALQERAQTAAQANRLDAYWEGLADATQEMYSYVRRLVRARDEYNKFINWSGADWPQQTVYGPREYDVDPPEDDTSRIGNDDPPVRAYFESELNKRRVAIGTEDVPEQAFVDMNPWIFTIDYSEPLSVRRVICGSLEDSLNAE
jgi:hypothetical protein